MSADPFEGHCASFSDDPMRQAIVPVVEVSWRCYHLSPNFAR